MPPRTDKTSRLTREAVAEATSHAAEPLIAPISSDSSEGDDRAIPVERRKPRMQPGDPLVTELRRHEMLPLLVLHFTVEGPCYGNQLIERISAISAGVLSINPNTMYPLLRDLESRGLIAGQWEHPERRSRRFYGITDAGRKELDVLAELAKPALDAVARSVLGIKAELFPEAGAE